MGMQRVSGEESGIDKIRYLRHTYSGKFADPWKLSRL